MAVVADLHVHTTNSDGTLTLGDLPAAARRAGLDAVAVTDHDRLHPGLDASVADRDGVTVVHGVELRVRPGGDGDENGDGAAGERVDLLGYGVVPTPALRAELDRLQDDRVERARAIVECVEDRLGVALDVDLSAGVGRPHVARAVASHPDAGYDVQGVFDDLVGDGRPCYVPRAVPSFERGVELLSAACGLVGLAHPLRYDDPAAALSLCADPRVGAVEVRYPYDRPVDLAPVRRAVREHDLVVTGGSDAHGDALGAAGLDAAEYRAFRSALSG